MFRIDGPRRAACDGITRRKLLEAASAGLFGLTLPRMLAAESLKAGSASARAKAVIFINLFGGPSQLETFDLSVTTGSTSSGASYFAVEALIFALHMESPEGAPLSVKVGCSQIQHRLRA